MRTAGLVGEVTRRRVSLWEKAWWARRGRSGLTQVTRVRSGGRAGTAGAKRRHPAAARACPARAISEVTTEILLARKI